MVPKHTFNVTIFTDSTKKMCLFSATSIFIIVLFIISPLSNFFKASFLMKIIALILILYTIYLNINQTNLLRNASSLSNKEEILTQININILCSYLFTLFIGVLFIFVVKSFL